MYTHTPYTDPMPAPWWPTACNGAVTLVQPRPRIVSQHLSTRREIYTCGLRLQYLQHTKALGIQYYLMIHRCLNIGTGIVTVRAVTERDEVEFRYSPDRYEVELRYSPDRYDTSSNIQTTMSYSV